MQRFRHVPNFITFAALMLNFLFPLFGSSAFARDDASAFEPPTTSTIVKSLQGTAWSTSPESEALFDLQIGPNTVSKAVLSPGNTLVEPAYARSDATAEPSLSDTPVDTDSDGVPDDTDTCPMLVNVGDVDLDGIDDSCDPLVDTDVDGVADSADACPAGAPVVDADADGCEDTPAAPVDTDSDGVTDDSDACPTIAAVVDTDADGCEDTPPAADSDVDAALVDEWITLGYAPDATAGTCVDGVHTPPVVNLPASDSRISEWQPRLNDAEGTFSIAAWPIAGYKLRSENGWVAPPSGDYAVYTARVDFGNCNTTTPVNPTWKDGTCKDGEVLPPTVVLPANRFGITYDGGFPDAQGAFVVVAVLDENYVFSDLSGTGWDPAKDGRSATFEAAADLGTCTGVIPATPPESVDGTCTNGVYSSPTVTAPADSNGISYVVNAIDDSTGDYTITATVVSPTVFGDLTGTGWDPGGDSESATWYGAVSFNRCRESIPVTPESATAGTCTDGVYTPPIVTAPSADNGITYAASAIDMTTGAYTITATLNSTHIFGDLEATAWDVADDLRSAIWPGTAELNLCAEPTAVAPILPASVESVCLNGVSTTPSVTPPIDTDVFDYSDVTMTDNDDDSWTFTYSVSVADGYSLTPQATMPLGYVRDSDTAATYQATMHSVPCRTVTPIEPFVTDGSCIDGVHMDPSVAVPQSNSAIAYTSRYLDDTHFMLTARLSSGYIFNTLSERWDVIEEGRAANWTGSVDPGNCVAVDLTVPTAFNGTCIDGVYTDPYVELPINTDAIEYSGGSIATDGTFNVTATLASSSIFATLPAESLWRIADGGRTATWSGTVAFNLCGDPTVLTLPEPADATAGSCIDGVHILPKVHIPADGGGIVYIGSSVNLDTGVWRIHARAEDGYSIASGNGWTVTPGTNNLATYEGTVEVGSCGTSVPVQPGVATEGTCIDGIYTPPSATAPDDGNGITYVASAVDMTTGAYTITATLDGTHVFGDLDDTDWDPSDDGRSAIWTGSVDPGACTEVDLSPPTPFDGTCIDGNYTDPYVVVPDDTDSIEYTPVWNVPAGTFTLTATLASSSIFADLPNDSLWHIAEGGRTATWSWNVVFNYCGEPTVLILPVPPAASAGSCVNGSQNLPYVNMPADGGGINYTSWTINGAGVWRIHAQAEDGYTFAAGNGWTVDAGTNNRATYEGIVDRGNCVTTVPVLPALPTEGTCIDGVYTPPTATVPGDGNGISYVASDVNMTTGGYTITATLDTTYVFGGLADTGWVRSNDQRSAEWSGTADLNPCVTSVPAIPTIVTSVCVDGEPTTPSVNAPDDTDLLNYSDLTSTENDDGSWNFTFTVTVADGAAFDTTDEMPDGYLQVSNSTATFATTLEAAICQPVKPADPTIIESSCRNDEPTDAAVTAPDDTDVFDYSDVTVTTNDDGSWTFDFTVTVSQGHMLAEPQDLPAFYSRDSNVQASYQQTLYPRGCTPSVAPSIVSQPAACVNGTVTEGTFTVDIGIGYTLYAVYDGDTIVTASRAGSYSVGTTGTHQIWIQAKLTGGYARPGGLVTDEGGNYNFGPFTIVNVLCPDVPSPTATTAPSPVATVTVTPTATTPPSPTPTIEVGGSTVTPVPTTAATNVPNRNAITLPNVMPAPEVARPAPAANVISLPVTGQGHASTQWMWAGAASVATLVAAIGLSTLRHGTRR